MNKRKIYTHTSTCDPCGTEFKRKRPWQHFCHPNCRMVHFIESRVEERKAEENERLEVAKLEKERLEARQLKEVVKLEDQKPKKSRMKSRTKVVGDAS
jgi:hypothetical protein